MSRSATATGVHTGRAQIGVITSATRSPILGRTIALARVDVTQGALGTEVEVGKLDGHQKRLAGAHRALPALRPGEDPGTLLAYMIRAVLLDLAGVVYQGEQPLPGTVQAIASLRNSGFRLRFLTNTTRMPRRALLSRLNSMGIAIADEELVTPAQAARAWLAAKGLSAHLLIHPALQEDFANLPASGPEAVVIGDAADGFTYAALNEAFRKLLAGAAFLRARTQSQLQGRGRRTQASTPAPSWPRWNMPRSVRRSARQACSGFLPSGARQHRCDGNEAVMVGDDAEADVAGALTAGLGSALLVRTGKYRPGDETKAKPAPSDTVADLAAAARWIMQRRA